MKNAWFQNGFENIVRSYVDAQLTARFTFIPQLPVESLQEQLRAPAQRLVAQVKEKNVPGIEEAVNQAIQSQLERIPQYLQAVVAGDLRKQFLVTRYFEIIREVLCSEAVPEPFRVEPEE